ncbi:MAG: tRNA (adenosine(37)-N6)-dimethylallyltransferase MiaA [Pseudorhodobacter sp.]|nr:tRNA (adenosine(37)-N6)-dimethylallyltransferase MiaA [Pseudorhodobacter sp.]
MQNMKIIVILGQTATGKSDFAVYVARQVDGEIISADSRQVYKGMDLGTGKIIPDTKNSSNFSTGQAKKKYVFTHKGVPHYLLDVASPSRIFTVSDFQKLANKRIEEIIKHGKIPIICGGTGFYIDAVVNGTVFPEVPPNKKLRDKLYPKDAIALFRYLEKLDPERAKNIDKNNKVRLVRAIEIAKALGSVPKLSARQGLAENKLEVLKIGLTLPPEILKERIKTRLLARIKKGMIKEIENLHKDGLSWKRLHSFGLEYRYVALYLQNKLTKKEMIEKLNTEIWHYAKRQKTWFKRDPNTFWINPLKKSDKIKALKEVKKFLK